MYNPRLIINADDFGYNHSVNIAIVSCFKKGIINSTTIMANMEGFEEAVRMAYQNNFKDKVGLHVNLTEGFPLTDMSGTGLVDQHGKFVMGVISKPFILFPPATRRKIKLEIISQYDKLVNAGISPTHIDSHQHVHTLPLLVPLFADFAKDRGQKLRMGWSFKRKNFIKKEYIILVSAYFRKRRLHFTDTFSSLNYLTNYLQKSPDTNRLFEVMIHPDYRDDKLIEIFGKTDIEKKINDLKQLYFPEGFEMGNKENITRNKNRIQ